MINTTIFLMSIAGTGSPSLALSSNSSTSILSVFGVNLDGRPDTPGVLPSLCALIISRHILSVVFVRSFICHFLNECTKCRYSAFCAVVLIALYSRVDAILANLFLTDMVSSRPHIKNKSVPRGDFCRIVNYGLFILRP